ncbi:MAG: alcohol dehydrogenase catalytic domain-containing protein [Albidovulum sp.]|nr:MAG: alcohol dehydrogenase catalytic domain-containing protein [Defluviimonas sp.]
MTLLVDSTPSVATGAGVSARRLRLTAKAADLASLDFGIEITTLRRDHADQVLVEIHAAGVNPSDVKAALGQMPYAVWPRTPGRDFAGIVIEGPTTLVGQEVWGSGGELGIRRDGTHASHIVVDAASVRPKPKGVGMAEAAGIVLDILTGRDKGAERAEKLTALKRGAIQVLVGTHALFQKDVEFHDLRLAIVDEQHRFGVAQRMELAAKGVTADMLVMTATPIPRSLSLAQYGDMDVSVLDEKPPGRKPVKTALVSAGRYDEVVGHLRQAVAEGRQAYWVCPLVEESEAVDLTAAAERFRSLRAALGEGVVGLVHGQMPPAEKDAAMADFVAGRTKVLVATTVIEVGVNVPDASIMVIERAEIFGLAQLHQLRGRVGRGAAESTCLLMYQPPLGGTAERRLQILRETEDGFRIAEEDLAMRGAGDLIGTAQSGLPRFRIADLERQAALMAVAQRDARKLLAEDAGLATRRGAAARVLLWLMEQDRAIRLISVG